VHLVELDAEEIIISGMPARKSKTPAVAAPTSSPDAKPAEAAPVSNAEAKVDATQPAPAKEKKPRPPPKIVTGSSVSETRVRKALSNSMGPEVSLAIGQLKLLKDKDGKTDLPKKFGELSDATVALILAHKPKVPTEEELKSMKDEQKKQLDLRNTLYGLLQGQRSSWSDRQLTKEEAKALRRMIKQDTIRTGDDAIDTFTATANYVVRDLARAGLKNLKAEEKRVIKLHHVVEDITTLESWPLIKELKCVAAARVDHAKRLQDAAQKLLEKKEKQKKKKADKVATASVAVADAKPAEAQPAAPQAAAAAPSSAPVPAAPEEKVASPKKVKTPEADFEHHSQNIVREVCQSQNVTCEISGDVKHFCSLVVYELVCMYGDLIQNQTGYADVKTIKANTITSITNFILTYTRAQAPGLHAYVDAHLATVAEEEKKAKEEKAKKNAEAAALAATAAATAATSASGTQPVAASDTQPVAAQPVAAVQPEQVVPTPVVVAVTA
jgi:hypothetical protein